MKKGIYIIIVFATFWCGVLVSNISKVKNNRCNPNASHVNGGKAGVNTGYTRMFLIEGIILTCHTREEESLV